MWTFIGASMVEREEVPNQFFVSYHSTRDVMYYGRQDTPSIAAIENAESSRMDRL